MRKPRLLASVPPGQPAPRACSSQLQQLLLPQPHRLQTCQTTTGSLKACRLCQDPLSGCTDRWTDGQTGTEHTCVLLLSVCVWDWGVVPLGFFSLVLPVCLTLPTPPTPTPPPTAAFVPLPWSPILSVSTSGCVCVTVSLTPSLFVCPLPFLPLMSSQLLFVTFGPSLSTGPPHPALSKYVLSMVSGSPAWYDQLGCL